MKHAILFVIAGYLYYGSLFCVDAQARKRQQPSQQKTSQPSKLASTRIIRPALLGDGVAVLPNAEFDKFSKYGDKLKQMSEANADALKSSIEGWTEALRTATNGKYDSNQCKLALMMFMPQLDSLWEKDQFVPAKLEQYVTRLKILPQQVARTWEDELNKVTRPAGGSASELNIIGFLIQLDRLFTENDFRKVESEALLVRLRSLSPDAIKTLKEAIKSNANQAAVVLIQYDPLFTQNQFQEKSFDKALDVLKAESGKTQ